MFALAVDARVYVMLFLPRQQVGAVQRTEYDVYTHVELSVISRIQINASIRSSGVLCCQALYALRDFRAFSVAKAHIINIELWCRPLV